MLRSPNWSLPILVSHMHVHTAHLFFFIDPNNIRQTVQNYEAPYYTLFSILLRSHIPLLPTTCNTLFYYRLDL
jgi:hypothetical protein